MPSITPTLAPGERKQGDLDGDVDPTDAVLALAYQADVTVPNGGACQPVGTGDPMMGDVNCDDAVAEYDALWILSYVAGVPFPDEAGCTPIGHPL